MFSKAKRLICVAVIGYLCVVSCGKVTQINQPEKEEKAFDVSFTVPIIPSSDIKAVKTSKPWVTDNDIMTNLDDVVYMQVYGLKKNGEKDSLSWGKGILVRDKVTPFVSSTGSGATVSKGPLSPQEQAKAFAAAAQGKAAGSSAAKEPQKPAYASTAFNIKGLRLEKAQYGWGYLSFDTEKYIWKGDAKDVKKGYDAYMVVFYMSSEKAYIKVFDESLVKNNKLDLGRILPYDSFISSLYLEDVRHNSAGIDGAVPMAELASLFTIKVFDELRYTKPANGVKTFDVKAPSFIYYSNVETVLLNIASLVRADEKKEAKIVVDKLDAATYSKAFKKALSEAIDSFSVEKKGA